MRYRIVEISSQDGCYPSRSEWLGAEGTMDSRVPSGNGFVRGIFRAPGHMAVMFGAVKVEPITLAEGAGLYEQINYCEDSTNPEIPQECLGGYDQLANYLFEQWAGGGEPWPATAAEWSRIFEAVKAVADRLSNQTVKLRDFMAELTEF